MARRAAGRRPDGLDDERPRHGVAREERCDRHRCRDARRLAATQVGKQRVAAVVLRLPVDLPDAARGDDDPRVRPAGQRRPPAADRRRCVGGHPGARRAAGQRSDVARREHLGADHRSRHCAVVGDQGVRRAARSARRHLGGRPRRSGGDAGAARSCRARVGDRRRGSDRRVGAVDGRRLRRSSGGAGATCCCSAGWRSTSG